MAQSLDKVKAEVVDYARSKLATTVADYYLKQSAILLTELDPDIVWDIIVLMSDFEFSEFVSRYGPSFVVDDHEHDPPIFTKFRSFSWVENDFQARLPIALWIYQNSLIVQDPQGEFQSILARYEISFSQSLTNFICKKYLEFRTERHNLRQAVAKKRAVAIPVIKATVVKLALEICLLVEKKPYPYKKWLPEIAKTQSCCGQTIYAVVEMFLEEKDGEKTIKISEELVCKIKHALASIEFAPDLLERWWLYLE